MRQKVVIIGHSFSSRLSIIRSVAQIGCEVVVVVMTGLKRDMKTLNKKKPIDCYSKYVSSVHYCWRKDKEAFIRLLLEHCTDPNQKVVLIPDSDDTVVAIDNNRERLKEYFCFPHILSHSMGDVQYWMDKTHQKSLAKELGLNVTEGRIIDIENGCYSIPEDLKYPCFSKPLATMNGGKGGMRQCRNALELAEALDFIIQYRCATVKVLVEDYKEINEEYAVLGFSDGENVCIPGVLKFISESGKNKGIARQGMVMPIGDMQPLVDVFKQLVLKIGFVGVFDIDFYESDGVFYFCEINLRFGGSGYAITKMGVNLPAMMVKYMTASDVSNMDKTITGTAIYANERMCLDDWYNGYISFKEYKETLSTADIRFVPDATDPIPEKKYEQEVRRLFLKWKIKKILKALHLK